MPRSDRLPRRLGRARRVLALRVEELEPRLTPVNQFFLVPGDATAATTVAFQWLFRDAAQDNEVGAYVVEDEAGRVNGLLPGDAGYREAALQNARVVFTSGQGAGDRSEESFNGGDRLAFYLVPNDTTDSALAGGPVFFSVDGINADGFQHTNAIAFGDGSQRFFWEDEFFGGDRDFNDVVFSATLPGSVAPPTPGQPGQTVPATFTWLQRDAAFNNELGVFITDDAAGTIGGLRPGDAGYARAALSSASRQVIFASGQGAGAVNTLTLPAGAFYGLYLITGTSTDSFLAANPDNTPGNGPFAFFAFTAANPDGVQHMNWISATDFVWEDQFGGGDADFNDLVGRIIFGDVQGESTTPPPDDTTPDTNPPTITAQLANDTTGPGGSDSDSLTSDPSVRGTVTDDVSNVIGLRASLDDTQPSDGIDVLDLRQPDGTFLINDDRLTQINGGVALADGPHTLHLQAGDARGNVSAVFDVAFTLDRASPAQPTFNLAPESDTGTQGDARTDLATVNLTGTTDPNTLVQLVQTGATTTSDAQGNFTLGNVSLQLGANGFTVRATDSAGNTSEFSRTITRPSAPFVREQIADRSLAQNASQTIDLAGVFDDADIANSVVQLQTATGPISIELFDRAAPRTVTNFLNYITDGDYTDSIFHRSAKLQDGTPFVLQGGGFTFEENPSRLVAVPADPAVQNEPDAVNRSNLRGTVAMAKLGNDPNSATNQFFFNLGNNASILDGQNGGFTVFGRLSTAADQQVVDALASIPTQDQGSAAALPPAQLGVFTEIPLQGYSGSNFPTDTVRENYALVSAATVLSRSEELTYSVVGNTNPAVVTTTVNRNRLTLQAGTTPGTTTITVRATDRDGLSVDVSFQVTVA